MQIDRENKIYAQGKENHEHIRSLDFEYNYLETVRVVTVLLQADNDQTSR